VRFVIDETSWCFEKLAPATCVEAFEVMLDRLDHAYEQGHAACYSEELFSVCVWQDKTFYDLYAIDSPVPIPHEVRERLASVFNRLPKWQDLEIPWPSSFDVRIDGDVAQHAASVAWAHAETLREPSGAVACVIFPGRKEGGCRDVAVAEQHAPIWFVSSEEHYSAFFRWLITETTRNPGELAAFALSAFPAIEFVVGVFDGIKGMSKPYRNLVADLVVHLGALSDHGQRIFAGPWLRVPQEFGALRVEISDENGNTRANAHARNARTVVIRGEQVVCWWHTKLQPDRDRIHIFPYHLRTGGKLVVGIFCRHLVN
jgi:hypothetical protein